MHAAKKLRAENYSVGTTVALTPCSQGSKQDDNSKFCCQQLLSSAHIPLKLPAHPSKGEQEGTDLQAVSHTT